MSFEDGMKGFTFGMISLICIGVNIILTTIGLSTIASIVSLGRSGYCYYGFCLWQKRTGC